MIHDTIIAQCTPSGNGALSLLRISGPHAWAIANKLSRISSKKKLIDLPSHTIHHGWVVDQNNTALDEVLFFLMRGPKTFTGEDVIEITCHNNQFVIENIIARAIECGARPAQAGEFSRQAVENDKLDLLQAEAINELIHANSQQLLKQSLEQLQGSFSQWINTLETNIITLISLCEASFEFLEEDMDFSEQMLTTINNGLNKISDLKKTFDQQQHLREGIRIAIIGSVNAGKSSLFNTLIGKKRAIVTNIAGTTRDVIEAGVFKNGTYQTIIDTAGLRTTDDIIEQEGIKKSYQEAKTADIVLLVIDGSRTLSEQEKAIYLDLNNLYKDKVIILNSKSDLPLKNNYFPHAVAFSSVNSKGIEELLKKINSKIVSLFSTGSSSFLLNKRHYNLLIAFEKNMIVIKGMLVDKAGYEIISYHLNEALASLTELTGKSVSEKALDNVFKSFCVGK